MSEQLAHDDEDDASGIRALRAKAKRSDALERENRSLRQELAFRDSGLSLNDAQRDAIIRLVGDDQIDAAGIREHAEALCFVAPPQVPLEEQTQLQRMAEATDSATYADYRPESLQDRTARAQ